MCKEKRLGDCKPYTGAVFSSPNSSPLRGGGTCSLSKRGVAQRTAFGESPLGGSSFRSTACLQRDVQLREGTKRVGRSSVSGHVAGSERLQDGSTIRVRRLPSVAAVRNATAAKPDSRPSRTRRRPLSAAAATRCGGRAWAVPESGGQSWSASRRGEDGKARMSVHLSPLAGSKYSATRQAWFANVSARYDTSTPCAAASLKLVTAPSASTCLVAT